MQYDMLGREPFVTLLDNIITQKISANEGFSFAIDGKWGCGKSWIIKELEKKLEPRYFVVHYNCWENEYYDEPLVAILSVIIDKLNQLREVLPDNNKKSTVKIALTFLTKVISIIIKNKTGIDIDDIVESGKEAIANDKEPDISKDFDKNQPLKKALEIVRDNLLKIKLEFGGVIFVVDELDRCLPEYAIKVMQRLHHICYDNVSDTYVFVQLAAINKSELLGSIAKTFGREFNLTQKYTDSDGINPGRIFFDNFDETQLQFGNYYFKKFFQMIIPVSNGEKIDNPLLLLDGFENNFDLADAAGKEYAEKFFSNVLSFFPMRTKLELVHIVKTTHEITAMNESLDKHLKYNTLCIELIDCLCKSVLKKDFPIILHKRVEEEGRDYLFLRILDLEDIEGISDITKFTDVFENWSKSECGSLPYRTEYGTSTYHPFTLQYPESYIKAFYEPSEGLICKKIEAGPIPSETAFINAFRKTLDNLV